MSNTSKQEPSDGGKRSKLSRSLLPEEEADQRGNAGGGEDTLKKGSEADQRVNAGGGEVALKKGSEADQTVNVGGDVALKKGSEADQTVNAGGEEVALKKGPWTKEEDEILKEHIKKHGEGNWKAVQKESGLARCGKSCRLRWSNHLRPGVKKGLFTAEEERLIFESHFLKGSKWAHMASLLPGRTDNEIKNFWHTRSKKRQRAGLPIYPDEITSKYSLNGSQESADTLANESSQHDETETFNLDITDLDLKYYKFRPDMLPLFFDFQDYKPITDLDIRCSDSTHNTLSMRPSKCPRTALSSSAAVPEVFDQHDKYPLLSTPCDPILNTNLLHGYDNAITGIHAASNISPSTPCDPILNTNLLHGYDNPITGIHAASNISPSEPIYGSMSFELPSFQNSQTQQCTWSDDMYMSPLPSFESVDTPVQAPPIESCPSVPDSSDCGYLIDPIEYYNSDQNLNGTNIDSLQANTDSMPPNEADISTQWNGLDYDAIVTSQLNILRRAHSEIKNTQRFYINRGAFNNQLPTYYTSNKEDNLNQKDLVLPVL